MATLRKRPCLRSRTLPALSAALVLSAVTVPAQSPEPLVLHILASDTGQPLLGAVASIEARVALVAGRGLPSANGTSSTAVAPRPGQSAPTAAAGASVALPTPPAAPSLQTVSPGYRARTDAEGFTEIPNAELKGA